MAVENVPDATVEAPTDAVARITTTNICGSDLHMCQGRTSVQEGEVSVSFNIACGTGRNCIQGWTSFCLRTNPTKGMDGAAYG